MLEKSIGKKLKELRTSCKMTQDDIAELLNMNRTSFSKYENGASNPPLDVLRKLALIFNVPIEYLIHDDIVSVTLRDEKNQEEPELGDELKAFTDLTRSEKMLIMKLRLLDDNAFQKIEQLLDEE